uniref:Ephrin-A1 n=1 Tax=Apteryx owenii TaxID=8824 RepID=A0A8B9QE31_APTOW
MGSLLRWLWPRWQRGWLDYAVEVRLNDYLDIICPHYEEGSVAPHTMERYTLYLVEQEEYVACKPRSKEQVRWECNKPSALHGPEKFSEKFQRFTPFTLGKEFKEGHSYYYICECPGPCAPTSAWGPCCLLPLPPSLLLTRISHFQPSRSTTTGKPASS